MTSGQAVITAEVALTMLTALAFVLLYGNPNNHSDKTMAWHIVTLALAAGVESAALLLLAFGITLPIPVYVLVFGSVCAASVWRLVLYIQTLHRGG